MVKCEVKDGFLRRHKKMKMVCALGIPDQAEQEVPLDFIGPVEGQNLTEDEILRYCKGKIASYKIPKHLKFIKDWPTTATGKIQRFKLKEMVKSDFQS